MAQCRKYSNYICIMFFWIGTLVPVSKQFDSLLKFIHEGDMVDAGNYTCQDMLPYFSYFPFYIETTRRCQLAFLLQTIPMIWYVYSVISKFKINQGSWCVDIFMPVYFRRRLCFWMLLYRFSGTFCKLTRSLSNCYRKVYS